MSTPIYAFPRKLPDGEWPQADILRMLDAYAGMTLRDYFAAHAVAGICAKDLTFNASRHAADAYAVADALLLERDK